jgi:peptidylprolyl isomerase
MRKLACAAIFLAAPALAQDGPGPNLVIDVAGETSGRIVIDMLPDVAPNHVDQITALADEGAYDGVAFHRVIEGFMAQTGDVQCAKAGASCPPGTGGSERPDIDAEFSDVPYDRGIVGMARAQNPNSANSQFFIMFQEGYFLNGQYTVVGRVIEGMDVVDSIKRGVGQSGAVQGTPDIMQTVTVVR